MRDPFDIRTLDLFDGQVRSGAIGAIVIELHCPACGEGVTFEKRHWFCTQCGQAIVYPAERVPKWRHG